MYGHLWQKSELQKNAEELQVAGCRRVLCASCHWMQLMKQNGMKGVAKNSQKHIRKKNLGDFVSKCTVHMYEDCDT